MTRADSPGELRSTRCRTEPGPVEPGTSFLGMNLLCSATQAGNPEAMLGDAITVDGETVDLEYPVDCGDYGRRSDPLLRRSRS